MLIGDSIGSICAIVKTPSIPPYLGGQGDLLSGLIMGITRVTIWINRGY